MYLLIDSISNLHIHPSIFQHVLHADWETFYWVRGKPDVILNTLVQIYFLMASVLEK